ncbi:hypothetical protein DFH09DRAFT_1070326 [Mycena vulgaris]|nr:hypothetical protein DFH09DRAFT_1070326 [Mycena vulgaris]
MSELQSAIIPLQTSILMFCQVFLGLPQVHRSCMCCLLLFMHTILWLCLAPHTSVSSVLAYCHSNITDMDWVRGKRGSRCRALQGSKGLERVSRLGRALKGSRKLIVACKAPTGWSFPSSWSARRPSVQAPLWTAKRLVAQLEPARRASHVSHGRLGRQRRATTPIEILQLRSLRANSDNARLIRSKNPSSAANTPETPTRVLGCRRRVGINVAYLPPFFPSPIVKRRTNVLPSPLASTTAPDAPESLAPVLDVRGVLTYRFNFTRGIDELHGVSTRAFPAEERQRSISASPAGGPILKLFDCFAMLMCSLIVRFLEQTRAQHSDLTF